jgi:transposase-like protein
MLFIFSTLLIISYPKSLYLKELNIKQNAISAVKNDNRLIADVAKEYGISNRKLFQWINAKPKRFSIKNFDVHAVQDDTMALKIDIQTLLNEVQLLRIELRQSKHSEKIQKESTTTIVH